MISQNLRKILGRISVWELSISKVLDFQLTILLKKRLLHMFFSRICQISRKTLWKNTFEWLLQVFSGCCSNKEFTVKKLLCWYQFFTYPYFWLFTKQHNKDRLLLKHFEWHVSVKISKFCVWNSLTKLDVGRWLSVRYRTPLEINFSNPIKEMYK